jgi:hypothetical protein
MKCKNVLKLAAVSVLLLAMSATAGNGKNIQWRDIIGIVEAGNLVGRGNLGTGTDGVLGGAPWSTLGGGAKVNLDSGKVQFHVKGLVLAAGSNAAFALAGLPIGTPDGVTEVEGTLVCDVDGSAGGGTSVVVDTAPVTLSSTGDAQFSGSFGSLPSVCSSEPDIAFLIRIVSPAAFKGVWIANGAVLDR